jgi:hypothetical protein
MKVELKRPVETGGQESRLQTGAPGALQRNARMQLQRRISLDQPAQRRRTRRIQTRYRYIMKHPKHLWFTAILVSLLSFAVCSKAQVTTSQTELKNESLQPKPFNGEVYESVNGLHKITLTSSDEAEITEGGANLVCKYTKQGGRLRILVTALGTTKAEYFQITADGLQDSEGTIYFTPSLLAAARQLYQGVCYATGEGVAKNEAEAVKWYRKAADQNFAAAQYALGLCYRNGQGVAKDYLEAAKWHRKAANQNFALAQNDLGVDCANGIGVAKDEVEAVIWYRKAADQNLALAQDNLGGCYAGGRGVTKDEVEAVKWYRKAAEQGNAGAQNDLAWILATSTNSAVRDGADAVIFAEKAVAATNRRNPGCLDTLAAAYAEVGQFEGAVSTEQEAIAFLQTEAQKDDYRSRLKLYKAKAPYQGQDIPALPSHHFNDYANVVSSATASRLDSVLQNNERESTDQIVVAVFPKMLSDAPIDNYAMRVFNSWGVGQKGKNNGVILFVFVQDHKMFLQVGSGLVKVLPDATCQQILNTEIRPHLKVGDFDGGLNAGVTAIIAATQGAYHEGGSPKP